MIAAPIAFLTGMGCRQADEGPAVYPVSGKVLVDGKPASKAEIVFHRLSGGAALPQPIATAEADGTFRPSTRISHDGAPAGDYALTVVWRKITTVEGEEVQGADLLRGRYSDPGRSGLKATVKEGDNTLPAIELKSTR